MGNRIIITGAAGFIGSHFVEHILKNTSWNIVILDKLNYASNGYDRLRDIKAFDDKRVQVFAVDLTLPIEYGVKQEIGTIDYIVHMAAETHVDNSIKDPKSFVMNNIASTLTILEYARDLKPKLFVYFSTDEVFGPALEGSFKEWDRYNCTNPYSASKAGGEELCLAYSNTYKIPMIVTHTMNVFGERQHSEKFIPLCIKKILAGEIVYIHSDSKKEKAGSRMYIHARNVASAVLHLINTFNNAPSFPRDKFNIVGEKEMDNFELAKLIAHILKKPLRFELVDFHSSRPGHDLRYALDGSKLAGFGWKPSKTFEESLRKTVEWTLENERWLK